MLGYIAAATHKPEVSAQPIFPPSQARGIVTFQQAKALEVNVEQGRWVVWPGETSDWGPSRETSGAVTVRPEVPQAWGIRLHYNAYFIHRELILHNPKRLTSALPKLNSSCSQNRPVKNAHLLASLAAGTTAIKNERNTIISLLSHQFLLSLISKQRASVRVALCSPMELKYRSVDITVLQ